MGRLDPRGRPEGGSLGVCEPRIGVLVELGHPGARTGARTLPEARAIAERATTSATVRLAGVAGYEGAVAHDHTRDSLSTIRGYLRRLTDLHTALADLYGDEPVVLTACGSAYFDLVDDVFGAARESGRLPPTTRYVLRSGATITHDDGFYHGISPLDGRGGPNQSSVTLTAAVRGRSRVLSRPEPGLALLDGGKRDFPYDEGLPRPLDTAGQVIAMNDQHTFLAGELGEHRPRIGDLVELGLSHPCTAFDKWRLIPVVDSRAPDATVVDLIETFF